MVHVRRTEGREARIGVIAPRISLSNQYLKDLQHLGFKSYQDRQLKGVIDLDTHPRVVIQIDSLPRAFSSSSHPFDLIICDEWAQTLAHVFQERGGASPLDSKHLAGLALKGLSTLRGLIVRAGRLWVADNDLNSAHIASLVKYLRPDQARRVVRCTATPWEDQITASMCHGSTAFPTVTKELMAHVTDQLAAYTSHQAYTATAGTLLCNHLLLCPVLFNQTMRACAHGGAWCV